MADESLRVSLVCARFPPFVGGTEAHVFELSRRLADRGHDVRVLTTVLDRDMVGSSVEHGVRVERMMAWPKSSDLHFSGTLRRLLAIEPVDIMHVQGYHTLVAPMAMSAADRLNVPYLVTFHSGGHSSTVRRAARPVQHRMLRRRLVGADGLIGVSAFESDFFAQRLRIPSSAVETIPNGVAPEFTFLDRSQRADRGECIIVSFGRLEDYKGHDKVIRAFARSRQSLANTRLRLLGDGPERDALISLADELGVGDSVDVTSVPYGDRQGLADELRAADLVVLMSSYESQGIAGYEALATGARLIVADGSALTELGVYPGVEVVPLHGGDELTEMISLQLERPPITTAPDLPTWDSTTDRVEATYRRVAAHRVAS